MSAADLPAASPIESKTTEPIELEALLANIKSLEAADLFKVMKQALNEAEKRSKGTAAKKGAATAKKAGSMPKGVVPKQLRKPRAWVDFTLQHALENGWEPFVVYQTKKDKKTGEEIDEEIEMAGSELHEGAWVYEGSVTEALPTGKQIIQKDAMSLSKQRWAPKTKVGTHPELYAEFEEQYVEEAPEGEADETESTTSSKKTVVRMTAADKAAAAEAKKAEKEAEKAAKKAEKEAEKAAKKLEKEQEKAAKKLEKEQEKAAAKAAKEAAKKPTAKSPIPAAAIKKPIAAAKPVVKPAAVPVTKPIKKAAAAPVVEWSCPADGMAYPWPYKGKQYLRTSENLVWERGSDGGYGDWQGVYVPAEDRIDDSVPEPEEDEE
jgi:hypothetical protein